MFNSVFFLITGCFVMLLLSFTRSLSATGSRTYFLLENEEIFEKCDGHPGNGIHDLFDMSTVNIEVLEYGMHVDGYVKLIWDVEPTDRISIRFEFQKFQRGTWQPTVFTVIRKDFCSVIFTETEVWYDAITSKVVPEDRHCINEKGKVYHFEPIDEALTFQTRANEMEGRHKLILEFEAFDEMGQKRPNTICTQAKGEFMKL